ncbi:trypsin-like serine protease [Euryarchaeota archaeon]|nr:trypsin-like serine protease [Euryarchaeota archaeon]
MISSEWGIQGVIFSADHDFSSKKNFKKGFVFTIVGSIFFSIIVVFLLVFSILLGVVSEVISEWEGYYEITDFSDNEEFGYRLDVNSDDYINLAANKYPYSNLNVYPDFSSTVYINGELISDSGWFTGGSGVIISSYWILTAAHVVEDMLISETYVYVGDDYENYDNIRSVKEIHIHPGWDKDNDDADMIDGVDIALIRLSSPINQINPSLWANSEGIDDDALSQLIYSSGFGDYDSESANCSESCLEDSDGFFSQKRAWSNTLDRMNDNLAPSRNYQGKDDWKGGLIAYDFDSPSEAHNSLSKNGDERSNKYGYFPYAGTGSSNPVPQELEGMSVPGDSGGPSFTLIDNEWYVIAVTSFGLGDTGDYGEVSFDTRVSVHSDWICSISDSGTVRIDGC